VRVAAGGARESIRLADRDNAQPREDRPALGLAAQQYVPGVLAGVFDQLARRVDDAGDGAYEGAVVALVELGLVATQLGRRSRCGHRSLCSVGSCMRPVTGEPSGG
jgi:hypothetical protein